MRPLLIPAAVFCLLAAPAVAAPDATEIATRFHGALAAGDAAAAAALLADDLTVYEEGYVESSKAAYVSGHLPADIAFTRAVPGVTTSSQTFLRGDTAWVISEGTTRGTFEGREVNRITTETMLLRLDPGGWKIVHIHWSSHKAPAT